MDDAEDADIMANAEVQAAWLKMRAQQIHMGSSQTNTADSKKDEDHLEELIDELEAAVKKRDGFERRLADARRALDYCIWLSYSICVSR